MEDSSWKIWILNINKFERAVEMYNIYGPTSHILTAYRQRFPRENFDKIRNILIENFEMNNNFEMNEMEQISNALNRVNLKDDYKQKYILEWLRKTYNHQVTPEHTVDEGIAAE